MIEKVLIAGDVDAIKEFVFETSFLPQIRGGSQLLIECEEQARKFVEQASGSVIYCGGGGFLFEVPKDREKEMIHGIENIYLRNTHVATVTIASKQSAIQQENRNISSIDGWALRIWKAAKVQKRPNGSFGIHISMLSAEVREKKMQKTIVPFVEALPFGKRCDCCGKRMVLEEIPLKRLGEAEPGDILRVCEVCLKKHNYGRLGVHGTRGKFNDSFYRFAKKSYPQTRSSQPSDLDDLVKGSKRNYLAFLYADGNDIGNLLNQLNRKEDYIAISEALSKGTEMSLFDALLSVCGPALNGDESWPFEIINVGGDDVTLLIQAGYAWEVAVQFLENFENTIPEYLKEKMMNWPENWQKITASCGIAIADERYPMRYLQKLAEGSLKKAKRRAKEDANNPKSAIDFLWLPNPVINERIEPLMGYYLRKKRSLTARPYTLEEAKNLQGLVKDALGLIPSTQRHLWGEALDRGINASRNAIYYNIARQSDAKKRRSMEDFLTKVTSIIARGNSYSPYSLWLYRKDSDKDICCTALLDILELAELLSMRNDFTKEVSG